MSARTIKEHAAYGLFGLSMGVILSAVGFSDFKEVHRMFIFADFRLLLVFATAVALAMVGFALLGRRRRIPTKTLNKGTVPGSIAFGAGWAITGACPSIALVQLGEGQLAAVLTLLGILFGVWIYRRLATGALQLDTGVCGEE
ncbi:MAG: YeeE/YedE family protein [Gammaproteobacteria bacterium]|nr:YeeE/YedE family protein [Gammaproteobacteria bacterium]